MTRLVLLCLLSVLPCTTIAAVLRLAVGLDKPPYIEHGGSTGLESALVIATLNLAGHPPKVLQLPQARGLAMLKSGQVDAMMSLAPGAADDVYYSQPLLYYRNRAIVLQNSGIVLRQLSDLSAYRVASFQNARLLLGSDYRQAVSQAQSYDELADQDSLNRMLLNKRVDVVISDDMIFHANPTQRDLSNQRQAVQSYALFPNSPRHVGFRNAQLRAQFDNALLKLKSSGAYDRIYQFYRDKYQLPRN